MEETIEQQVLKELVIESEMQCLACNVRAVNTPTWESHKMGKRYMLNRNNLCVDTLS